MMKIDDVYRFYELMPNEMHKTGRYVDLLFVAVIKNVENPNLFTISVSEYIDFIFYAHCESAIQCLLFL